MKIGNKEITNVKFKILIDKEMFFCLPSIWFTRYRDLLNNITICFEFLFFTACIYITILNRR